MINETRKRGPKFRHSDQELKEMALQVKKKYKNQAITSSILQRETGIGRNTWNRRIKEFTEELNRPIPRELGLTDDDIIYFPNIESIFELYGNDKNRLISELHKFEILLQDIYQERTEFKKKAEENVKLKEEIKNKNQKISDLVQQLDHYRTQYERIMILSMGPQTRAKLGVSGNLLDFKEKQEMYETLHNFQSYFHIEDEAPKEDTASKNIAELKKSFPNLFKKTDV